MAIATAVRQVRQIQIALLVSIALYTAGGELIARRHIHDPANTLFHALSFVSISLVGATVVVRRTLVLPSETALKGRYDDPLAVARWKSGYIFLYTLCDLLGLFGLLLRVDGFTLANVCGFYLGGFLLLLLYSPRAPRAEFR
ncbi:MAG: hypothetical protein WBW53_23870 [Terriglobales bacterium]